jgi:polyisoprenoid-binding protein YceI
VQDSQLSRVHGNLDMHGVRAPVVLEVRRVSLDSETKPERVVFEATGQLDREDFGLNWNTILDTGKLLLGNDVVVTLRVVAIRKPSASEQ